MKTYHDLNIPDEPRLHPYIASREGDSGFVDFIKHPELIETSLEDFIPFANTKAIQTFYNFLRWANGNSSIFATSDCALRPPAPHHDNNSTLSLRIISRVVLLYRDIHLNSSEVHSNLLYNNLMEKINAVERTLSSNYAVIGFSKFPVLQTAIAPERFNAVDGTFDAVYNDPAFGHHLTLSIFVYGNTEKSVFGTLERVFCNIWSACRLISKDSK